MNKEKVVSYNPKRNYKQSTLSFEKNSGEDIVVPGQGLTVRQMFEKHASGTLERIYHPGIFIDNPDIDDDNIMIKPDYDLTDHDEVETLIRAGEEARREIEEEKKRTAKKRSGSMGSGEGKTEADGRRDGGTTSARPDNDRPQSGTQETGLE